MTPAGVLTVLHHFTGSPDGNCPQGITQGTDGNFYGVTVYGGVNDTGTVYKLTRSGTFTVVHTFGGADGAQPEYMIVDTNGIIYGWGFNGGTSNEGVCYSLKIGAKPFVSLVSTSGEEGAKIGVLGQGFGSASVVEFGGVQATSIKLTGKTFISATK